MDRANRVLIVGRSAPVLTEAVAALREKGYGANATNRFDSVPDDYDAREVDLVLFGGQVPADTRARLEAALHRRSARVRFASGLGGIVPLLVAQVEEHFGGVASGATYDPPTRTVRLEAARSSFVSIAAMWGVATGTDPLARTADVFTGKVSAGAHAFTLPGDVPEQGAFVSARVDGRVSVFRAAEGQPGDGKAPGPRRELPEPARVATQLPWETGADAKPLAADTR